MLTLLPPTFQLRDKPSGSNGTNTAFYARYWTGHPYAKGIAAQEVREARIKMPFVFGAMLLTSLIAWFTPLPRELLFLPFLLPAAIVARIPSLRRKVEIAGQAVECVVRRDHYGTDIQIALSEAARQIAGLKHFGGSAFDENRVAGIRADLAASIPSAEGWARSNRGLIERA
jgi:hypothetical protein